MVIELVGKGDSIDVIDNPETVGRVPKEGVLRFNASVAME